MSAMGATGAGDLRGYQVDAVQQVQRAFRGGARAVCLQLPTGCHRAGQRVLMFDGTTKAVEQVAVGDLLMGPDSRARAVLALCRGTGAMVRIVPRRGDPFVVNLDHVLTLVKTQQGSRWPSSRGGEVVDVSVREWLAWSTTRKHLFKLFRTGVDFPARLDAEPLPVEPYFLGLLIGDGCLRQMVGVAKPDIEIRDECARQAAMHGLKLVAISEGESRVMWRLSAQTRGAERNPMTSKLRALGLYGTTSHTKFIPPRYLVAPREDRLALLAGLLDSDGHARKGGFDWISASERLAREFAFLARGLGLFAHVRECEKRDQNGRGGTYWRVGLSGDCSIIPTRIPRKQAEPRLQKKDHLRTGFSVERLPEPEPFYGFTLSGDGRYLLDDFTVTHNSGKTHCAAVGIIAPTVALRRRVIFLADLEEILLDTVGRLRALGIPAAAILAGRADDPGAPVQVASQQTLVSWMERGVEIPPADRVILDECHGAPARTTRALLGLLRSRGALLLGLTATPARGDGQPLDEFDTLVCGPQPRELVAAGALVPCEVLAPPGMQEGLAMDPVEAVLTLGAGRRCVVFAPHGAEAQRIAAALRAAGHATEAVLDATPTEVRRGVRARLESGETRHVVTCKALVKGFDAPVLDCAVLTSPGTIVGYLQSIGRVLRPHPASGKRDALVIDLRGGVYQHGLPLDDRAWSLAGAQGRTGTEREAGLRRCSACHAIFPPRTVCPRCGSTLIADPRPLRVQRAEMFAASTMPVRERASRYIEGTARAMQARGMRAEKAAALARAKAPAWVKEALGTTAAQGDAAHG